VPHVDDFPKELLRKLIEPSLEELKAGSEDAVNTAIALGLEPQIVDELVTFFESEPFQASMKSRYDRDFAQAILFCSVIWLLFLGGHVYIIWGSNWDPSSKGLLLALFSVPFTYGLLKVLLGQGFRVRKQRILRWLLLDALFAENTHSTSFSRQNSGDIRELPRFTGLPVPTLNRLSELHQLVEKAKTG